MNYDMDLESSPFAQYICPISHLILNDAVVADDGYTYEKEEILNWLNKNSTSPMTRGQISKILRPNQLIKTIINEKLIKHPQYKHMVHKPIITFDSIMKIQNYSELLTITSFNQEQLKKIIKLDLIAYYPHIVTHLKAATTVQFNCDDFCENCVLFFHDYQTMKIAIDKNIQFELFGYYHKYNINRALYGHSYGTRIAYSNGLIFMKYSSNEIIKYYLDSIKYNPTELKKLQNYSLNSEYGGIVYNLVNRKIIDIDLIKNVIINLNVIKKEKMSKILKVLATKDIEYFKCIFDLWIDYYLSDTTTCRISKTINNVYKKAMNVNNSNILKYIIEHSKLNVVKSLSNCNCNFMRDLSLMEFISDEKIIETFTNKQTHLNNLIASRSVNVIQQVAKKLSTEQFIKIINYNSITLEQVKDLLPKIKKLSPIKNKLKCKSNIKLEILKHYVINNVDSGTGLSISYNDRKLLTSYKKFRDIILKKLLENKIIFKQLLNFIKVNYFNSIDYNESNLIMYINIILSKAAMLDNILQCKEITDYIILYDMGSENMVDIGFKCGDYNFVCYLIQKFHYKINNMRELLINNNLSEDGAIKVIEFSRKYLVPKFINISSNYISQYYSLYCYIFEKCEHKFDIKLSNLLDIIEYNSECIGFSMDGYIKFIGYCIEIVLNKKRKVYDLFRIIDCVFSESELAKYITRQYPDEIFKLALLCKTKYIKCHCGNRLKFEEYCYTCNTNISSCDRCRESFCECGESKHHRREPVEYDSEGNLLRRR
jgi:hypothetical protein